MRGRRHFDITTVALKLVEITAAAAGSAFPVGPVFDVVRALSPSDDREARWFAERLVDEIGRWCEQRTAQIGAIGGPPSDWQGLLRDRLSVSVAQGPLTPSEAIDLLNGVLFVPLAGGPESRRRCAELAAELTDDLDEIVARAGDRYGAGEALRRVMDQRIDAIETALRATGIDDDRVVDRILVGRYLSGLIAALDRDTWTRHAGATNARLSSLLCQRVIDVHPDVGYRAVEPTERRAVTSDDVFAACDRLVILGRAGDGKSWLARDAVIRTARQALGELSAPDAPEAGADPGDAPVRGVDLTAVELPLFARCSAVLEPTGEVRWSLLVRRSVERSGLYGEGRTRLEDLLEAHPRVVVVLDGLDETRVPAGALDDLLAGRPSTRVVLTSRPTSWARQLELVSDHPRHRIGHLRPLTYPDDVYAVVRGWLADQPARAEQLLARLETSDGLADQATNPLLCAMLCLVAATGPVPNNRVELYAGVIRRLLASTWRGERPTPDEVDAAEDYLVALAWAGAEDDEATGLGAWPEEIRYDPPDEAIRDLVSNVADRVSPMAPHARDHGRTFLHRTLRDHLVARHLASRPAEGLAAALLPRLWFDRDWTEVVPLAIAAHPHPSAVLRYLVGLLRTASPSDPFGVEADLLRRVGAEVAPGALEAAQRALVDQALGTVADASWQPEVLPADAVASRRWQNNTRFMIVLRSLLAERDPITAFVAAADQVSEAERDVLRAIIVDVIAAADPRVAAGVATAWRRAPEDKRLRFLGLMTDVVADLDAEVRSVVAAAHATATPGARSAARRRLVAEVGHGNPIEDATRAAGVVQLATTTEEQIEARQMLIDRIKAVSPKAMGPVTTAISLLQPTAEQWGRIGGVLLGRMRVAPAGVAATIAGGLASGPPSTLAEGRRVLLERLVGAEPEEGAAVAATLLSLEPTAEDLVVLVKLVPAMDLVEIGSVVRAKVPAQEWLNVLHRLG